jgi:gamma-glutamyltranspeptidase/glutathione hydrolase
MAPTLVKMGDDPFFSVGAPGGTRIVTGILHAILNVIDQGMTATEAIAAPRFDCQSDVIVAHSRIAPSVCEGVRGMGHGIHSLLDGYGGIASVHGIILDPSTGALDGGGSRFTGNGDGGNVRMRRGSRRPLPVFSPTPRCQGCGHHSPQVKREGGSSSHE